MGKFVINCVMLGKRVTGYRVYVSETKEFIGLTEKQIKDMIQAVKGSMGLLWTLKVLYSWTRTVFMPVISWWKQVFQH